MKKSFLFILVFGLFSVFSFAQDTLNFSYDDAGNQVEKEIPPPPTTTNPTGYYFINELPKEIRIFPNPTSSLVTIDWTEAYKGKIAHILIMPVSGYSLLKLSLIGENDLKFEFDMTSQIAGIYPTFIYLKDGGIISTKIIKQ